jgi:hypothetical protein
MAIERLLTSREAIVWELWDIRGGRSLEIAELLDIEVRQVFDTYNDCQRKIRQTFQQQEHHVTDLSSEAMAKGRAVARERTRREMHENARSDHPRHMDDFDEGFNAGVAWARREAEDERQRRRTVIDAMVAMQVDDEPFTPGQYKQVRGIAPPREGQPTVEQTMRAMRDEP